MLATGIGAGFVGKYVSKIVTKVTNNENLGRLAGFGATLVSGYYIFKGLDSIDQALDVSGLYPKNQLKPAFAKCQQDQIKVVYREDISKQTRGEDLELVRELFIEAKDYLGVDSTTGVAVYYDSNSEIQGFYDRQADIVFVNMRAPGHNSSIELADTIAHELRHAWQYQQIQINPNSEFASSLNNYVSPQSGSMEAYSQYRNQLCELDAWEYGGKFAQHIANTYFAH